MFSDIAKNRGECEHKCAHRLWCCNRNHICWPFL